MAATLLAPGLASAEALDWHPDLNLAPQQLSAGGNNSDAPQVAVSDSGAAVAVWGRDEGAKAVPQASFRPPGGNFGAPQTITATRGADFLDVAMNGRGDAVVAWYESGDQSQQVSMAYAAAGQPFGAATEICCAPNPSTKVAIDPQGNALVIWSRGSGAILGAYRPAAGSFTQETVCSGSCPFVDDLAMAGNGEAIALFHSATNNHVLAAVRPAGAAGRFGSQQDISGSAYPNNCPAQVAADAQGDAVAAWVGYTGGTSGCSPDGGSTLEVRGAFRPAGQAFASPRAIDPPPNPDPRNLSREVRVAMDTQGNAVVAYDRVFFINSTTYEGHLIAARTMPAGGWFGAPDILASTNPGEDDLLDLGNVAMNRANAVVAWSHNSLNSPFVPQASTIETAVRPAGGAFAFEGTLSPAGAEVREPIVALGADGGGAAVWTAYDEASLSDVIQGRLILPQATPETPPPPPPPDPPPPPPPPTPPPGTGQIRIANKVEKSGPLVLTADISGDVDRLEWTLPGASGPVVGEVVDGQLQRSVRFRPEPGSSFPVTVRAVGPGGTQTFGRSFKMPRARSGDAADLAAEALEGQPAVFAAGVEAALVGGSPAKAKRAAGCGPTTLYSATIELHGCMRPVDALGQIPGPELGAVDTLASRLHLPRDNGDVMRAAVELSDGYSSAAETDIGGTWPVVPRGGASLLAFPQVKALTSSNAALRVGGVDFTTGRGFKLDLKSVGGAIPLNNLPRPPSLPKVAGLPLVGDLDVSLEGGEALIKAHLKLPSSIKAAGVDVQSSVTLRATPDRFLVDGATIGPINVAVGAVDVKDFRIDCAPCSTSTGTWNGQGRASFAGGLALDMIPPRGGVTITDGNLTRLAVGVDFPDPGLPLSDNVFLESINGGFGLDPTRFFAGSTIRAYQLVTINGQLVMAFPSARTPFILDRNEVGDAFAANLYGPPGFTRPTVGMAGTASLNLPLIGSAPMANAYLLYEYPGYFAIGGGLHVHVEAYGVTINSLDIVVNGEGDFDRGIYNFHGDANACIIFLCGAVVANISNVGFAACVTEGVAGETISQGIQILWSGKVTPWPIDGCKWSRTFVQVRPPARTATGRAAAPGVYEVKIEPGDRSRVVQIDGDTGAPRVRVQGPDGQVLESSDGDGQAMTPDGSIRTMSLNGARVTSVGLQDPRPGTYTIEAVEGSAAITQVSQAEDPPAAKVKAKVTSSGDRRVLEYDIRNRPDQSVTFFDVAEGGGEQQIGVVKGGGHGTLRFSPAPGSGKHQIVAQFELAGTAAERQTVASFKPPSPRLAKVRHLRVSRRGKTLRASWGRVPGADGYELAVTTSTGTQQILSSHKTRKAIRSIPASSAGRVSVRAVAEFRQGEPSVASFKRTAPPQASLTPLPRCKLPGGELVCKG